MRVPALLFALIALLAISPGVALCGDACEARYGEGRRPLTPATGSPGELGRISASADVFVLREDATLCR